MILLALDPSIRSCGLALFDDSNLVAATTIKEAKGRRKLPIDTLDRCARMAADCVGWVIMQGLPPVHEFVTEWPQVYTAGKGRGDPNQLTPLAAVATGIRCLLEQPHLLRGSSMQGFSYLPKEWAGSTEKATRGDVFASARARRIHSRLIHSERSVWDAQVKTHDCIDAVGIGLHHLGRLGRYRVFPGAT